LNFGLVVQVFPSANQSPKPFIFALINILPSETLYIMEENKYKINLDIKYGHLEVVDVPQIVAECKEKWFNQTLTKVNDSVVRVAIVEGEFHWHKHDREDEFFFVLEGHLFIDLEERTIELDPGQGVTISKEIMHRPRSPKKTVMLVIETDTVKPTGD
jgi:mannose-6-phosphate isomerase-like protein (cupin superfamily)